MYLDLGQTVLMLCRWIHCLRLKQCLSSYYVCLFLLVHQPPISSSFNLLAFYPSHPHLYFHFYTHTHMQTLLFQTFISISPFIFPHRHPMSKTTLFLTVFQFTPLTNRTLNGPILFLCTLTCPTHPPSPPHHVLLAQHELCPSPPCPHIHFCLQLLHDGGSRFLWNVNKYLQTTQQQIPEDDHFDVYKVFNTPNVLQN